MEVEIGDTVVINPMDGVERSKLDHEEVSVEISCDAVVDNSEDRPSTTAPNPFGDKSVIKSTEMALKAASDSVPAVIVTDENENKLEHDEMGLNPIEDIDALQDIHIKQNTHLCDTGLEKCLACSMIPEEFVEQLLCKTDKALCTCEMTDWMENTTGYNLCGDEAQVLGADDDETRSVDASLIMPWEDGAKNNEQKDIESSMIETVIENKDEAQEERNEKDAVEVATILHSETKSIEIDQDEACLKETKTSKLCFDDEKKVGSQYMTPPPLTPVGPMETVEKSMVIPSSEKKKFSRKALIRKLYKKLTLKQRTF